MGMQMLNNILAKVILEKWNPSNKEKHSSCKAKVKARVKKWPSAYASMQVVQCYYGENTDMKNLKQLFERQMTDLEMKKEKKLHKKVPKEPFISQYGEDKGEDIYYATTKKMAMESTDCGCDRKEIILEALKKAKSTTKTGTGKKRKGPRSGSPWFRHKSHNPPFNKGRIVKRSDPDRGRLNKEQQDKQSAEYERMKAQIPASKMSKGSRYGPAKKYREVIAACATLRAQGKQCGKGKGAKKSSGKKSSSQSAKA